MAKSLYWELKLKVDDKDINLRDLSDKKIEQISNDIRRGYTRGAMNIKASDIDSKI